MLPLSKPSGTLSMGVDTWSTKKEIVPTTLTVLPGSAVEQGPPSLHITPTADQAVRVVLGVG
jgi:hypothetical protein